MANTKTSDGRGNFGDPEEHARAGKAGGEATAKNHDKTFYEEIGREGGNASSGSFEKGDQRAVDAGRKGGKNSSGNSNS
ncbi:general stress protein [Candidatus Saccharibacteria bacterium]|nr:general stress protein [Candidatus Saccharibacteria bacterium]